MIGQTVSHYKILEKLGEGGMGIVYKAEDLRLHRPVALKFLPPAVGPAERARLVREAEAVAQLDQPNICTVYEVDDSGEAPFIAMAFVEGTTLKDLRESRSLPVPEVLGYALQIARGLQAAHRKMIVHRDVKSANIMVTPDGQVKIMDFGLAKLAGRTQLTRDRSTAGTIAYMSPEQARGEEVDQRTDLWSLGVVLYELLAGRLPFRSDYDQAVVYSILNDEPPSLREQNPAVPPELESLVLKLLRKEKGARHQSADEVLRELEAVAGGVSAQGRGQWGVRGKRFLASAGASLALITAVALLALWLARREAPQIESIAVLPLENLSGDSDQEYLVDGIHEALITDLTKLEGLKKVIARASVVRFRGRDRSLGEIARELNVDALVTGAVARAGTKVRVTAQLIDPRTEGSLWAERYEREMRDVLALQSEIVTAIASQLQVRISPDRIPELAHPRQVNAATYEAYLRGMYWLHKSTPEAMKKGLAYLREAVDRDPGDPRAYAGLAHGYMTIAHGPDPPPDALQFARAAAERAIQLDSTLASPYVPMGFLKAYYDYDWDAAQSLMNRAIDLNPHLAIAYYHLSWFHVILGRMDEALAEHRRAQELDPLLPLHTAWLGDVYRRLGRYDEAIAECRRAIEIDSSSPIGHVVLGRVYTETHRFDEAFAALDRAGRFAPAYRFHIGLAYAAAGRTADARKVLAELERVPLSPWWALRRAELHAALGENEEAIRWLQYEPPVQLFPGIRVNGLFKGLHGDPRFNRLLSRMNLPPP